MKRKQQKTTILTIVVLALTAASTKAYTVERYWTLRSPDLSIPFPYSNYFYSHSVIRYTQKYIGTSQLSSLVNFKISHTRYTLFDSILTLSTTCDTSYSYQDRNGNYYYSCSLPLLSLLEENSIQSQSTYIDTLYLRLKSGGQFYSYMSLTDGFYFTSSSDPLAYSRYTFKYGTSYNSLNDQTIDYTFTLFPFTGLGVFFTAQLVILAVFMMIKDKRRIPLYTIFSLALGYIPIIGLIRRGNFVNQNSGFTFLMAFFGVSLVSFIFICLSRASRKFEKTNKFGVAYLIAMFGFFTLMLLRAQSFSVGLITVTPAFLIVERLGFSKHRWLGLAGWLLTAAQGMTYVILFWSQQALYAAMLDIQYYDNTFPVQLYWIVSIVSLLCCAFGNHVKRSDDWKTATGPQAPRLTAGRANTGNNLYVPGGFNQGAPAGGGYAASPNNQVGYQNQGYGGQNNQAGNRDANEIIYDPF